MNDESRTASILARPPARSHRKTENPLTPFAPTTRITRQCQSDGSKGLPVHHNPHGLGRSLSWTLARKNFPGTSPGRDGRVDGRVAFADDFGILGASS